MVHVDPGGVNGDVADAVAPGGVPRLLQDGHRPLDVAFSIQLLGNFDAQAHHFRGQSLPGEAEVTGVVTRKQVALRE